MNKFFVLSFSLWLASCAHGRHQSFHARQSIEDTVVRLFVETDNKNWPAVKNLFADKVDFDMTSLAGGQPQSLAPDEIVKMWQTGLTPVQAVHHQAGNFLTTVDGDQAKVYCYGTATHFKNPAFPKKNVVAFVGSYDLSLTRIGLEWKITAFRFNKKYVD